MSGFRIRKLEGSPLWSVGAGYYSPKLNQVARAVPGMRFDTKLKAHVGYVDAIEQVIARLRELGLNADDPPRNERKWPHNLPVSYEGAREYQKEGIDFLINQAGSGALLNDDMGCIDGDAIVRINRKGLSRKIKLSALYEKFCLGRKAWVLDEGVRVRALCGTDLRLHPILNVLDKGWREVVRLTLKSGKTLRLTPDHEVATPDGFNRADRLRLGSKVMTNGRPKCKRCGSTEKVPTCVYAKFVGYCHTCVYRHLRKKPTFKGGKSFDKDGYVRVSGMHDHPRANRHGQVLEHHLVMEKKLGRYLKDDEIVHHDNEKKDDNRIRNLVLTTIGGHARIHGKEGGYRRLNGARGGKGGLVQFIPVEDEVVSVEADSMAHVYDIVCEDPHRNFVANGIVVHNCGKSAQAIRAVRALRRKTVIVCPAHVRGVWEREPELGDKGGELAKWWPKAKVFAPYGTKPSPIPPDTDVFMTHYDIVHAWVDTILEWAIEDLTTVFDEAHLLLNETSRRSKACKVLAHAARGRIALTGTPPTDRVRDLCNIVDTISPGRFGEFFGFAKRFCDARQIEVDGPEKTKKVVWDFSGKSNLKELRQRLDWFCLRRTKREVLKELPALQRQIVDVQVPPKHRISMNARLVGDRKQMRMALDSAADGKFKSVLALITGHLEAGLRVVVGTYRRAVCERFADVLSEVAPTKFIHGGVPLTRRGKIIDDLRKTEGACCLVANIDCVSTGIDLTFASVVVMAELVWEPRDLVQFESRVHRFGAEGESVLVQYVIARGTGDELIMQAVINKLDNFLDLVETDAGDGLKEALVGKKDEGLSRLAAALKKMGETEKRRSKHA